MCVCRSQRLTPGAFLYCLAVVGFEAAFLHLELVKWLGLDIPLGPARLHCPLPWS